MNKILLFSTLTVFFVTCTIRAIPTYLNYPYPIGYDSVNYYLPFLYNLYDGRIDWTTSYPIYLLIVTFTSKVLLIDLYTSFNSINIILYGVLGISIFFLFTHIIRISFLPSILYSIFVLLQLSVLRISWDLYRDLLSISLLNFCLILINLTSRNYKNNNHLIVSYFVIFCIILISVFADRMISLLLVSTTFILSIACKNKYLFSISSLFIVLFFVYFVTFDNITVFSMESNIVDTLINPLYDLNSYSTLEILVVFISLYGILLPFFIFGFLSKLSSFLILKIPTIITLVCSFVWIIVPNYEYLVPERWIIISGVFISIFAAYGFSIINSSIKSSHLRQITLIIFFSSCMVYGFIFILSSYETTATIPSLFQELTQFVMPVVMSMNTFDIHQSKNIVQVIDWINDNTSNSIVIGSIHWRGWFSLFLHNSHIFKYEENIIDDDVLKNYTTVLSNITRPALVKEHLKLCNYNPNDRNSNITSVILVSSNDDLEVGLSSLEIYTSGQFNVYNISKIVCMDSQLEKTR